MQRSILIVDDSSFARRKLREMLQAKGPTLHEAESGAQALEKYALLKPDVVLLDIVEAKVIIATADVQSATRGEALRLGARGVVHKPFNLEEIQTALPAIEGPVR